MTTLRLSLALAIFIGAPALSACVCVERPVKHGFISSDAVFVGRVVDIQRIELQNKTTFEVSETFKGAAAKQIVVNTESETSCGRFYEQGATYLVFATRDEAGVLRDFLCSHTTLASNEDRLRLVRNRHRWWRTCLGRLTFRRVR